MKNNCNNTVSVIIPVYNTEDYLMQSIQSIINQTYNNIELILVDDGSTDSSPSICDSIKADNIKLKVIHKENGGVSSARNTGILNAEGEYILFVDSDDYIEADMIEMLVNSIKKNSTDASMCGYYQVVGEKKYTVNPYSRELLDNAQAIESCLNDNGWDLSTCNKLYKYSSLIKDGKLILFDTEIAIGEDADWLIRVLDNCRTVSCVNGAKYNYRFDRVGSAVYSSKKNNKLKASISRYEASKKSYDFLIEKYSNAAYFMCKRMLFSAKDVAEEAYLQNDEEICQEYTSYLKKAIIAYIKIKKPNNNMFFIIKATILYVMIKLRFSKSMVTKVSSIKGKH